MKTREATPAGISIVISQAPDAIPFVFSLDDQAPDLVTNGVWLQNLSLTGRTAPAEGLPWGASASRRSPAIRAACVQA